MLKNFREFSKSGIEVLINLEGRSRYFPSDKLKVQEMKKDSVRGIKWESEGCTILIQSENSKIIGWPSPDLQNVISIEYLEADEGLPQKLSIYSSNGTLIKQLPLPELVSELAKEKGYSVGDGIIMPQWVNTNSQSLALVVDIVFGYDFFERRIVDCKGAIFGECVMTGRL